MDFNLNDSGQEKINQALLRKGLVLESILKKNSPVFTGQYKNLWSAELVEDGKVQVVNPQGEKGRALEFGGGEGVFPPVDELKKWVRRKIAPEDVDSTTYLIGRKIEREGIEPQPHIRPSIREFKRREG